MKLWKGYYTKEERQEYKQAYSELSDLIYKGDLDGFGRKLEEAVQKGFPVDFKQGHWSTLLDSALMSEDLQIASLLLDAGADPNRIEQIGTNRNYLQASLEKGFPEKFIAKLISAGADVNFHDEKRTYGTAFAVACKKYITDYAWNEEGSKNAMESIILLLKNGADPYLCEDWMNVYCDKDTSDPNAVSKPLEALGHIEDIIDEFVEMAMEKGIDESREDGGEISR